MSMKKGILLITLFLGGAVLGVVGSSVFAFNLMALGTHDSELRMAIFIEESYRQVGTIEEARQLNLDELLPSVTCNAYNSLYKGFLIIKGDIDWSLNKAFDRLGVGDSAEDRANYCNVRGHKIS